MDDLLNNPRRTPPLQDPLVQDPLGTDPRPETREVGDRDRSYWPFIVLGLLLLAGIFFFSSKSDTPNTQVGQNADRPAVSVQPPAKSPSVPQ